MVEGECMHMCIGRFTCTCTLQYATDMCAVYMYM